MNHTRLKTGPLTGLTLLTLLCSLSACHNGTPQATPTPETVVAERLYPAASPSADLTPGSKGEYKATELTGEIVFPVTLNEADLSQLRVRVDGRALPPEQRELKLTPEDPKRLSYRLLGLSSGQNIVIDIQYQAWRLSTMVPELKAEAGQTSQIDLTTTTAVAVAREAEHQGIRKLKDWRPEELHQLVTLPELQTAGSRLEKLYTAAAPDQDPLIEAEAKNLIQTVLDAFLLVLAE